MPDVSVVLPAAGSSPYLTESIVSTLSALTRCDGALLLVDDGVHERTRAKVEQLRTANARMSVIESKLRSLPGALNVGLSHVESPYVARMDADDICLPHRLERQLRFLVEHPQTVTVGAFVRFIDADGDPLGIGFDKSTEHEDILDALLCRRKGVSGLCHPSVMMRTDAVRKVGGYRDVKMGEDIDLFLRLAEVGRLANIPEILLKYRLHAGSITHNRSDEERRDSQRVRIEAYQRMGIPLPENLDALMPPPPPDRLRLYRNWSRMAARHGYWKSARKYAWRLLKGRPFSLDSWKTLVRSLVGFPSTTP